MKKLEGRVAIITGASRGVGEYMAREFAKEGCDIVVAARTEEQQDPRLPGTIHDSAREIAGLGVRSIAVRCDVTDEDSVRAMVARTLDEFGRIDILVNNAGIMLPANLVDMPLKRWDLIFQIDLKVLQVRERFSQRRDIRKMKGHVIDRFRQRLPFEERDRDVVVANSNAASEFEFLFQSQRALEPLRAFLRIAHRQSEVADNTERERNFWHAAYSRPQAMATEVVRLPPMLKVRNFLAFSIWRAPACSVSC